MNKHLHRVVFNASRGARMVVQEAARSAGKGGSGACGGATSAVVSVVALAAALLGAPLHAQIVADPRAPGSQRATILAAPNGVPLVNIQSPSAAGVSRNSYRQFDVGGNGAILNNSRTNVQSQLGGYVQGNPWLARGPARVILNEVNSSNPSYLRGFVEVAGQRAEVVIANPSGISVDGGGFINVDRATLTTGAPQLGASGSLDGYAVRGGAVSVSGAGLDASTTDSLAILARAFELSGALHATDLKVVAGANQVSSDLSGITPLAGNAAAPAYALDVAQLGGMYANHIALIVNEDGVGARNAGTIQTSTGSYALAGAGRLTLSASGILENSGLIQTASDAAVDAAGFANSGTVQSAGSLQVGTQGDLANHVGASGGTLEGQRVELGSKAGDVDNRGGVIRQTSSAALAVTAPTLGNTNDGFIGAEPLPASSGTPPGTPSGSGTPAGGTGTMGTNAGTTTGAGGTATSATAPIVVSPGAITAAGAIRNDGGRIYAGGPIDLQAPNINNAGGQLNVASVAVSGASFSNANGTLNVANTFSADVGTLDNAGGSLHAGHIAITTTGDLNNQDGSLLSDGRIALGIGGALRNTRGTVSAGDAAWIGVAGQLLNDKGSIGAATDLSVQAGSLLNTGSLRAANDSTIAVAGALSNEGGITSGRGTTITAASLESSPTGVLGAGVQADGSLGGAGDLAVATTQGLAANGTNLAAGNVSLEGASTDITGSQTSGANIALGATTGDVVTRGATVVTPGTLSVSANSAASQSLVNDAGTLNAGQLDLNASNIRNTNAGQIVQTGTAATTIAVTGTLDNSADGAIAGNGNLSIGAGSLLNRGGSIRTAGTASLDVTASGLLDNSASGVIGAGGNAILQAGSLSNDAGSVSAVGNLAATVSGAATNVDGVLAANGNTTVAAASLDNTRGAVAAVNGNLSVTTASTTMNDSGTMQAGGDAVLVNAGLSNTQGKVTGQTLSVETSGGALNNALGTLAATTALDLRTGELNNEAGLIQSGGAMTLDTHGQALVNTDAAGHASGQGGIASGGTLALAAGDVDNSAGFIGAKGDLTAGTGTFTNAAGGVVLGQADVAIHTNGAIYDNRSGQTLAVGNLTVDAGSGAVRNSGALIRSGGSATLAAAVVDNTSSLGTDQGIEGLNVAITADTLNNDAGAVRADANVTVTSAGSLSNVEGLMSAGDTLRIADTNAAGNPADKALSIVNTGGTLTADRSLQLDAATFSGDGTLASGEDLSIALAQDLVNNATVSANGNLTYATTGTLTNNGKLLAGDVLTVSGSDVENAATGEMRGDTTIVHAGGTLTNRGLIDGHDTRIDAGALVNAPTGRLYGDHLSIAAGSVLNDGDGTSAGAISARDTLDIGAGTVINRNGALIFSAGDMHIGGALDANRQATGAALRLENRAATIEALGDVGIKAATLDNLNGGVTWRLDTHSQQVVEFTPSGSNLRFKAGEVLTARLLYAADGTIGWTVVPASDTAPNTRLLIPSPSYPLANFAAYYATSPAPSSDVTYQTCDGGEGGSCHMVTSPGAWYGVSDPIWAAFGVTAPVRDLPADSPYRLDRNATVGQTGIYAPDESGTLQLIQSFAHPVTQAEHDEAQAYYAAHASLDAATRLFAKVVYADTDARNPDSVEANAATPNGFYRDYTIWNYTVTTESPVLETSSPAKILSGGDMSLTVGAGTNDMSQILAGRTLMVTGGAIANEAVEVQATTVVDGTAYASYVRNGSRRNDATAYNPATPPATVTLAAARQEGGQNAASGRGPDEAEGVSVSAGTSAAGGVRSDHRVSAIIEVPSAVGGTPSASGPSASGTIHTSAAGDAPLVVRTSTPDTTVPRASLFHTIPGTASHYLVETDPAFASYRNWLSSDYLLGALGSDPANVQKRLGDGFYEQRLIREQVAQLTGYRYLEGFTSDEAQYAALMDAGVTFAQQYGLVPGVALTAAQMAQLTSDIVWLVEQAVALPDGTIERVLVPQVYVRVKPGDIDGSGALLSADAVIIRNDAGGMGSGDVVNSGTIAGRTVVSITADNIQNLGGRITGGSVGLDARTDLNNLGGTIDAQNAVVLTAGRNITIASTTQTALGPQGSSTQLDRIAGVYVTNPGGTLVASAGNDVNLMGAILSNQGAGGTTLVEAGHDINLGTVATSSSQDTTWNAKNYRRTSESAEVGSIIATNGTTVLDAGHDISIRQGTVDSGSGALSIHAENDLDITAGRSTQTFDEARKTKSGGFLSKKTTTTRQSSGSDIAVGSVIGGASVTATAGRDIRVAGSEVIAEQDAMR